MLLCLDREQRLTYILGAIFGVSDAVGADLLGNPTAENFRQRLTTCSSRLARNFINNKCGLDKQIEPMPMCQEDPRLHPGGLRQIRTTFCSPEAE